MRITFFILTTFLFLFINKTLAQSCTTNTSLANRTPLRFFSSKDFEQQGLTTKSDVVILEANRLSGLNGKEDDAENEFQAHGNVRLWHYPYRLTTESLIANTAKDLILFPSAFRVETANYAVSLAKGEFHPSTGYFQGQSGAFIVQRNLQNENDLPFRGQAKEVKSISPTIKKWDDLLLTTCPLYNRDWDITASTMITDDKTNIGEMKHAVLRLAGVPVFYWPWLDFPLQGQRKSGFLFPKIERNQGNILHGVTIGLPYYFNLAPNYDWLFTPYYVERRGVGFENRVGYLTTRSTGNVYINFLRHDNLSAKEEIDPNRARYIWQHQYTVPSILKASALWNYTSDTDYLKDFSSEPLYSENTINLPLELKISNHQSDWKWNVALLDYQTLTNNPELNKPYRRHPQITFSSPFYQPFEQKTATNPQQYGLSEYLSGSFEGEYTRFRHNFLPNIERSYIYPKIQWNVDKSAGFFRAQTGFHLSRYQIESASSLNYFNYNTRSIPITKISTGLSFERPIFLNTPISKTLSKLNDGYQPVYAKSNDWVQTLEPELHWLYIPFRQQSQLPILDTTRSTFRLGQLDVDNNFTGWDRISDTHQITFGLTSRILNQSRREVFTLSGGQRLFLQEQEVVLPGESVQKAGLGDFVLNTRWRSDNWRSDAKWRYDPQQSQTGIAEASLAYQLNPKNLIGIRRVFQRQPILPAITVLNSDITQTINLQKTWDGVLAVELGKGWSFAGRMYYSSFEELVLERSLALSYHSCCAIITLTNTLSLLADRTFKNQWGLEVSLLGLTQLGNRSDEGLDRAFSSFRLR